MMGIDITELWFKRAVPSPTVQNQQVQVGCHFEEVHEMLDEMVGTDAASRGAIERANEAVKFLADGLKKGLLSYTINDRKLFVDACADQIVTATGSGYVNGMNVPLALERVNTSNFSKFDSNGQPIFNEHGKIAKSSNYKEADFTGCY
jgi:predicted HAD superfamily Cof-like phosphohydrolase